jgi:hypothetical protein
MGKISSAIALAGCKMMTLPALRRSGVSDLRLLANDQKLRSPTNLKSLKPAYSLQLCGATSTRSEMLPVAT